MSAAGWHKSCSASWSVRSGPNPASCSASVISVVVLEVLIPLYARSVGTNKEQFVFSSSRGMSVRRKYNI